MSTPAKNPGGVSGNAGITLNDWVSVDVKVTPETSGTIVCDLTCNGREVTVTFEAAGEVLMDIKEPA